MKNEWWSSKAREIQGFADTGDAHNFYNSIKSIYGPTSRSLVPVRSADGSTLIKDSHLITERWGEHFNNLLNHNNPTDPSVLDDLPNHPIVHELDTPPSLEEVTKSIRGLKNHKSPGPDGIPAEIFKHGGNILTSRIHDFISVVWTTQQVPQQWKDANIITIYKKKGDRSVCGNSRGISLLSVAGKVLARILLFRLLEHIVERVLPESQSGFRRERGTVDMIFVARQLQEKCREHHKDMYIAFIDLSKAFDTVNRELLWKIMEKAGCPPIFNSIIQQFHDGMLARVVMGGRESEPFGVRVGVKQGCVLAPVIFNIFLAAATQLATQSLHEEDGINITHRLDGNLFNIRRFQARTKTSKERLLELQYADDCALVAHTPEALQRSLTILGSAYQSLGLRINTQKTEIVCQWAHGPPNPEPTFVLGQEQLATVPHFKYLGTFLTSGCTIDTEIQNRINQTASAFGRLRDRVLQNHDLRLQTKMAVYQAVCISTLLYGCESWTLYRHHVRILEAFHMRCLRKILGITWKDKISNTTIFARTQTCSVETFLLKHQLRWLGHVIRMPEDRLPRKILYGQLTEGKRAAGGPKKRYKDHMKKALKQCSIEPSNLETAAGNRQGWRTACTNGTRFFEAEKTRHRDEKRLRRHQQATQPPPTPNAMYQCPVCGRQCSSRIGLFSHRRTHR